MPVTLSYYLSLFFLSTTPSNALTVSESCLTCFQFGTDDKNFGTNLYQEVLSSITSRSPDKLGKLINMVNVICTNAVSHVQCIDEKCQFDKSNQQLNLHKEFIQKMCIDKRSYLTNIFEPCVKEVGPLINNCASDCDRFHVDVDLKSLCTKTSELPKADSWKTWDKSIEKLCQYAGCVADCAFTSSIFNLCGDLAEVVIKRMYGELMVHVSEYLEAGREEDGVTQPPMTCKEYAQDYSKAEVEKEVHEEL